MRYSTDMVRVYRQGEIVSAGYERARQLSDRPYDYQQSLWRRSGVANSPGDYAGHWRLKSSDGNGYYADGLSYERRTRCFYGIGANPGIANF